MALFAKLPIRPTFWATKTSRWLLILGAVAMVAIGLGLLVLLTQATGNRERYNGY